jgi:hypothetical protein
VGKFRGSPITLLLVDEIGAGLFTYNYRVVCLVKGGKLASVGV